MSVVVPGWVRPALRVFAWALSLSLAACGGGGTQGPPASLRLADDAPVVAWNEPSTLDVLANDAASAGGLRLVGVSGAAHGQATVSGGQLLYTPAHGFYGRDSLTYTAQAEQGGATATAQVAVEVVAALDLRGSVGDGALRDASVRASAGDASFSTSADAAGGYHLLIRSSEADAFVTLEASGVGAAARVRLRSLAGSFGALTAKAVDGRVDATTQAALNLTHLSTAASVQAALANGGRLPATDAELDAALSQMHMDEWLDQATLLERIIDGDVALPSGVADSLSLIADPIAYSALLTADVNGHYVAFSSARDHVLTAWPRPGPPAVAQGVAQTFVYFRRELWNDTAYLVEYRPDGTAGVRDRFGMIEAHWNRTADRIEIRFDTPRSYVSTGYDPFDVRFEISGVVVRRLEGIAGGVTLTEPTSITHLGGPQTGQTEVLVQGSDVGLPAQAIDFAERLAIDPAEFGNGARWAGLVRGVVPGNFSPAVEFEQGIIAAGSGNFLVGDRQVDAAVDTSFSPGVPVPIRYVRLQRNAVTGEERWLAMLPTGALPPYAGAVVSLPMFRVTQAPSLTVPTAARIWRLSNDWSFQFTERLAADGSGLESGEPPTDSNSTATTWALSVDGDLAISRADPGGTLVRTWQPVARTFDGLWVLEDRTVFDSGGGVFSQLQRLRRVQDLGPFVP